MNCKKVISWALYLIFSLILLLVVTKAITTNYAINYKFNILIMIAGVIIYIGIIYFLYKYISKLDAGKSYTKVIVEIMVVIYLLQILFAFLFMVNPSWDFGVIYEASENIATGTSSLGQVDYLYMYTNNFALTAFVTLIFKISHLFGIINLNVIGILINIMFIDLGIFLTYLTCQKIFGRNKALIVFAIMAVLTPLYTYTPIYYSDTMSLPFIILPFYLYILSNNCQDKKKKIILDILTAIALLIGMSLKFTIVIPLISIVIYKILFEGIRKNIKYFITITCTIAVFWFLQNLAIKSTFDKERLEKEQFPFTHWIMMGLKGNGMYNGEDAAATLERQTKQEKEEYNISQIQKRLKEYYDTGTLDDFYINKLMFTWGDGTFYAPEKLARNPLNRGMQHEFILFTGEYKDTFLYFSQIQYIAIVILMIFSCYNKNNGEDHYRFVISLSNFGLILFLLIWEARSRYIVNYIPYFCILAMYGIDNFSNTVKNVKSKILEKRTKLSLLDGEID